ncbi:hypothetical protein [Acinetobacter sp. CFCC 10889]|uniref:hypothetical protein n=1 Tax=Acinetobacter sp. CFCC 10889 TaxID=1775557 RepID=UPI000DCF958A|nr:hypothetical protein [Acinetobacter sp. CFCC 10889]
MTTENERKSDSEYTKKYSEKRQTVRFPIDFYQDDEVEKSVFDALKSEPRGCAKKLIIRLLKEHYSI